MADVLSFPKGDGNDWPSVRESLRSVLDEKLKLSEEFKNHVLDRMASVYTEMPFRTEIDVYVHEGDPQIIQETIESFLEDYQEHIAGLLASRLMVEIELAIAKGIR